MELSYSKHSATQSQVEINNDDNWNVINSYFQDKHLHQLVKHQIESYNDFIQNQMKKTIEMFNPLVVRSIQDYIKEFKKYRLQIVINFENLSLYRPEIHENNGATKLMFPNDARLRNFTYNSNMTLDLNITYIILKGEKLEIEERKNIVLHKIQFGKIPIMLKSCICVLNQYNFLNNDSIDECKMDPGGYFIINGSEKTCLGQEKAADNKIYVFKNKSTNKWCYSAEMRCVPYWKVISPKQIYMMISSKPEQSGYHSIYVTIPKLKKPVPLFILFRALGVKTDKEICEYILLNIKDTKNRKYLKFLKGCIETTSDHIDYESCIQCIKSQVIYTPINMTKEEGEKKKIDFTNDILNNDLFPNCKTKKEKVHMLGMMTYKLISCFLGFQKPDDRDSYENKRIELTGCLLNNLFRNYFNKVVKDIQKMTLREINNGSWKSTEDYTNIINLTNIYKIVKSSTIENGIKRALSTGDFGIKQLNSNKVGVAQVLNRLTYASTLSHLRRINTPIDKSGKLVEPRKLHSSTWGFLCPAETPEGQSIGVVKNLSYMACITGYSDPNCIYDYIIPEIDDINDESFDINYFHDKVKVIFNGRWIGVAKNPIQLYNNLKDKKYKGLIHIYTSITFNIGEQSIYIYNDSGRLVRPVYKVKNNNLVINKDIMHQVANKELSWDDLLLSNKVPESVIEYIDSEEQKCSMISMKYNEINDKYNYTHSEIHPSTIFGVLASCIPFPEHNQSPRNTYQCAMGKQAMGIYASNFNKRMDKTAYILNYQMKPLVETRIMNMLKMNNLASGNQVIVAIMTHSGFNQEDSILFNRGSIDRGLFHATIYHTEKDEDKKINGDEEIRTKPNKAITKNIKFGNYEKLNSQGLIPENTLIEDKDIIMGKMITIKNNKNDNSKMIKYEDCSKSYKTHEECFVDKNYVNRNGDGYTFCKVKIRAHRVPNIGDKFSSRHGQKGTIGHIINEEDMPFTKDGLKPDLIINPHAIPSRMTIAQLKETLLGKVLLELGMYGDGTSFGDLDIKTICKELQKLNFESKGNEVLYDGKTGEQIETSIFIGPAFYQRLKHMVADKQHSRNIGPMVNLTRQPAEGRSRDGGLRFGEMERDATISHGAAYFTKERIYDVSDKYSVHVCNCCGLISPYNEKEKIHLCKVCDNRTNFSFVKIPYSCKLLFHELIAMNVVPRIMTNSM
jgi:DNA-directed RNA polymerase II subunit RPB2